MLSLLTECPQSAASPRETRIARPLRGKFPEFSTPNSSRKISAPARNRVASSARATPDQAARAARPAEFQRHSPDSPATPRSRPPPAGSTCSKSPPEFRAPSLPAAAIQILRRATETQKPSRRRKKFAALQWARSRGSVHRSARRRAPRCAASRGWLERSSPMMMSFRSGNCCSFCSSLFNAENASMMRTTFLCGRIAPAYRMNG